MAKRGAGVFKGLKNDLKALHLANQDDRMGDFRFTQDQLGAIFGNLSTSGKGIQKTLSAATAKDVARMQRASANGKRVTRNIVQGGQAEARNLFGSAIGGVVDAQFTQARGTQRALGANTRGLERAGALTVTGGKTALQAQRAGASEAASGAAYALATALKYRAGQDADLEASQKLAIDTMKAQSKLQWQSFKQQADYEAKKAMEAQEDTNALMFTQSAPLVAQNASGLSAYVAEAGDEASWEGALESLDMDPNDPGYKSAVSILSRSYGLMQKNGLSAEDAIQQASTALYSTVPGWDGEAFSKVLSEGHQAVATNAFIDEIAPILLNGIEANGTDSSQGGVPGAVAGRMNWNPANLFTQPDDERTDIYEIAAKYGYTDTQVLTLLNQYFPNRSATSSGAIAGVYGTPTTTGTTQGTGRNGQTTTYG